MRNCVILLSLCLIVTSIQANLINHPYYALDGSLMNELTNVRSKVHVSKFEENRLKDSIANLLENDQRVLSYREARTYLFGKLHLDEDSQGLLVEDVYCEKLFTESVGVGEMSIPNHQRVNCEHTWPQSLFADWENHSTQKTDLHHLYPTDSNANSTRGNNPFGEVVDARPVRGCDASYLGYDVDSGEVAFEPPNAHKGNVARALFYFSIRYNIAIGNTEEAHLRRWHREDPVDEFEEWRNDEIERIQGNRNPFIDDETLVQDISDF